MLDAKMRPITVGIVGAGTAGASAGTLLARAGHHVTVLERVSNPGPVGAGITIQPSGQLALARLGLLDEVAARGAVIDRLTCVRANGKRLLELSYGEVARDLWGLGMHRGNLFQSLFAALRASPAEVRCGVEVTGTELDAKGRWLTTTGGERLGPFELVIAADGGVCELHGAARRVRNTVYPWGAAWLVAEDRDGWFTNERRIYQVVEGAHTMLGFLPTGVAPGGEARVVSMFWSLHGDRVDAWRAAGHAPWRDRILALEPRAEAIIDSVRDLGTILFAKYRDVAMKPWHGDRLVFLGDAAHATSPQLGQGANLALLDAVAIVDELEAYTGDDINAALDAYTRNRRRHLDYYQWATRLLTPLFQSDSRLYPWLRDRFMPLAQWLGWTRRRMIRTMVGVDRGIVRRPMALAALPRLTAPSPRSPTTSESGSR
jgi:2-polyprenyl-6-methoxyphenol hydroxylase-like FAD-dependent oxidoreductase